MQIYFAPLEGITGFVFRNAFAKYYGGIDKYFTPFIVPHTKKLMDSREKRDILPENNQGIYVVPQVMTNKAEELIDVCKKLKEDFGYEEINLNLGCPSKTVTAKGRGSGFLEYPEKLEEFFDRFFKVNEVKLSIKTRIGYWELEEAQRLFRIFERFPFEEVIVHPRLGCELYRGTPHYPVFEDYLEKTKHTLCYNGDIHTMEELHALSQKWERCDRFMLGRGLIARPDMLNVDLMETERKQRFLEFHNEILDGYDAYMCGDKNTLFKMKELWTWWAVQFPDKEKQLKQIKKANSIAEYKIAVYNLIT